MADASKIKLALRSMAREHNSISGNEEWRVIFRVHSPRKTTHDLALWLPGKSEDPAEVLQVARNELHRISSELVEILPTPNPAPSAAPPPENPPAPKPGRRRADSFLPNTDGWMQRKR